MTTMTPMAPMNAHASAPFALPVDAAPVPPASFEFTTPTGPTSYTAEAASAPMVAALEIEVKAEDATEKALSATDPALTSGEPSPFFTEELSGAEDEDAPAGAAAGGNHEETPGPLGAWKKNVWTAEEDAHLLELIRACGDKVRWSVIGEQMVGRSGKQCRERWHNHLSPNVRKAKWSPEEDRAIVEAVQVYGTRWSEIVKMFPGRTDNAIKNRWNSMQRKEDRRQKRLHDSTAYAAAAATSSAQAITEAASQAIEARAMQETQVAERWQRRRLVQVADYQPAPALRAPAPIATAAPDPAGAVVLGAALAQQLSTAGTAAPQVKTGGRRKRAVQVRRAPPPSPCSPVQPFQRTPL